MRLKSRVATLEGVSPGFDVAIAALELQGDMAQYVCREFRCQFSRQIDETDNELRDRAEREGGARARDALPGLLVLDSDVRGL